MPVGSESVLARLIQGPRAGLLRAAGVVSLLIGISGCGGGGDDPAPPTSTPPPALSPAPTSPAPGTTQPAPAPLVVGTALSIDSGAGGNPVSLRVARSANGDGFAVWQADDGMRRNLWANRYVATAAAWGSAINIEASSADIDDFDLTVDANGNATVAWHEAATGDPRLEHGAIMSARFDSGSGAWGAPMPLNGDAVQPRVASNASGTVLAVYVAGAHLVRGRF